VIVRLTALYLAIFAAVLGIISSVAFWLIGKQYVSLLAPALNTPEGAAGYHSAMMHVAITIGGADVPLLILVGIVAYILARTSLAPLIAAREREKQFAADAAHELRSPLATIATIAQAARSQTDGSTREALDTIAQAALDASGLIGELLTLARDPRPGLLQREPLDVANVVQSCAREFELRTQNKAIALNVQAVSAIINGDERRLRELVRNLLDNALKHAQKTIALECGSDNHFAYIRVEDDGEGVTPELRIRIFERFFQANSHAQANSGNTDAAGSGLGLAIAHWIAHAHNGSLELTDTQKGATFIARFPQ
jgi:signal transduction histidine kinase